MPTQNKNGVNSHNETNPVHTIGNHMSKQNTKKDVECKSLSEAMLAFHKLNLSASKGGNINVPSQGGKRSYSKLEDVIEAVSQGNQFGLFFTQEIGYTNPADGAIIPIVKTTVHHVNDKETYVSELPIMLHETSLQNPQKIGGAITYYKRYTLQSVYGLPSEDDDGHEVANGTETKNSNNNGWR